jgi:adenylate kinase
MILVFLGVPGSGKGTQAQHLAHQYGFVQLSTGELMRKEIMAATTLGKEIKASVEAGEYATDEVVIELVRQNLLPGHHYILDGFPRTSHQAEMLDALLEAKNDKISAVFKFEVSDDVVIRRLSGRFSCAHCGHIYNRYFSPPQVDGVCDHCGHRALTARVDDGEESIEKRIRIYHEVTEPLENYYSVKGLLRVVDAGQPAAVVTEQLEKLLSAEGLLPVSVHSIQKA